MSNLFSPLNPESTPLKFEDIYIKVREKELRLYPDEILASLPSVSENHPHFKEWTIRKMSYEKLKHYLQRKNKSLHVLDVGCGNGWMSNKLSEINQSIVTGVDLNRYETEQAKRVFKNNRRLTFYAGDLLAEKLVHAQHFDIIVFAASIQYFPNLKQLISYLSGLLNPNGEIHIMDSPFYSENKIEETKEASLNYYRNLGCEEMSQFYHHHLWSEIDEFHIKIMQDPGRTNFLLKLTGITKNVFPWIIIYQA